VHAEGGRRAIGFRGGRLKTKTISRYNKFSKKKQQYFGLKNRKIKGKQL
jgi:hypothetical protein